MPHRLSNVKRALVLAFLFSSLSVVAEASPFSLIVVYGDSLSDNHNLFVASNGQPGPPYYPGRRSNGPVAVEQLAAALGLPLLDLAWIGATTGLGNIADGGTPTSLGGSSLPGMQVEYAASQPSLSPFVLATALFVVWGGPDDFLSPSPLDSTPAEIINRAVNDELGIVNGLVGLGAQNILVPGMPDLGLTPAYLSMGPLASALGSAATDAFNASLLVGLPAGVQFYDTAGLIRSMVANPGAYGFTNVTDPCFNGITLCGNPSQYLFFDDFHPTTAAHGFAAQGFRSVVAPVPEPATFVLTASGLAFCAAAWRKSRRRKGV
jgi:cholinesterase